MSMAPKWFIAFGAVVVAIAIFAVQRQQIRSWRDEIARRHEARRQLAEAEVENARLRTLQPSAQELATLGKFQGELPRLRDDVMKLNAKLAAPDQPNVGIVDPPKVKELPASDWKDRGRSTPQAAIETALWAAATGDIDVLADSVVLEAGARPKAEQLLASLPEVSRSVYRTPERLIALLAAKDLPAGAVSARISGAVDAGVDRGTFKLRLQDASGASQATRLQLRRSENGWRVAVSARAVDRFAQALKGTAP
jgi:hypothetical protein